MEKKMANKEDASKNEKKLSYEQLNDVCSQLYQQNQYLQNQLKQSNLTNAFKRLDYLFKVLEFERVIKDSDFIYGCIQEIKDVLTLVPEEHNVKQ